jgi:DNA (cytosine-5)-methyltransferase 1
MASDLLIRDVPEPIHQWIDREREERRLTKKEFMLSILREVCPHETEATLFDHLTAPPAHYGSATSANGAAQLPFTFIDLFAGIGGLRLGLENAGGRCLFSSELDKYAQKTYRAWFADIPHGDITKIAPSTIPDHDVLAAGFPCQPFSIAGVSKKNSLGREHGFKDEIQGTLFFSLATIAEIKRPPVLLLENVKNLLSHDGGHTWKVIVSTLEKLQYRVFAKVLDAKGYVPQHRERIFIVCFDRHLFGDDPPFQFPPPPAKDKLRFKDILEPRADARYTLSDHLWDYLQKYAKRHKEKGNGFGFGLADPEGTVRTLSSRYYKDGSEILIPQAGKNPRRLTPREAARLMGFDDKLPIVVSDTQAYRQFGNAVVPPLARAVAAQISRTMNWLMEKNGCLLKRQSNGS